MGFFHLTGFRKKVDLKKAAAPLPDPKAFIVL
jgi:hypothetical protein